MVGSSARTIVESAEFTAQREQVEPITRRWDEFWFALDWVLSRNPEAGEQVFDLPLWIMTTEPSPTGMPRLRILYAFSCDEVTLLWITLDVGGASTDLPGS